MRFKSKESYLKEMRVILSFFFSEDDVRNLLYDYEERLEGMQEDGHMTETFPKTVKNPWEECRGILKEDGIFPLKALMAQKKSKILLMLLLFMIGAGYAVMRCDKSGADFLLPAFVINFVFYILEWFIDTDGMVSKQKLPFIHILLLIYSIVSCLVAGLYIPNMKSPAAGVTFVGVILIAAILMAAMIIVFIAGSGDIQGYSLLIHHIITIVLSSFYFICQMHRMQKDILTFSKHIILGAIFIYSESIILYLIRIGINRFTKNYGRTIKTRSS